MIAQIRQFQDEDFSKLLQIDQACFEPDIAYDDSALYYFLYQIHSHTLVLVDSSGIVVGFGIAALTQWRGRTCTGHLVTLDLLPAVRRRGYGTSLLRQLEQRLAADGVTQVVLEVDVGNSSAIAFYLEMGYKRERRLKDYYGRGRDALRMTRQFSDSGLAGTGGSR